ncbi:hypothetical protein KFK09_011562 [Dendrobium nobile]|uniref:Fe2OG dioxygenase domain-containing protein n=1 Tax=Dendrobium nobile TaxID=94219 RepID=A0A8T3BG62_DENNO|nr:hypothetical protein KFK09_011562 [Dendrobium nobile]
MESLCTITAGDILDILVLVSFEIVFVFESNIFQLLGFVLREISTKECRPGNPVNFKSPMEEYISLQRELARKIMQGIALALGVPPETFEGESAGNSFWVMGIIGYPAHTDYGLPTLVNQDDGIHALQVKNRAGEWICAVSIPGTFVCNIGDMLKVWSNGLYAPTLHRVVNNSPKYRVFVVFFYEPNFETAVEPQDFCKEKTSGVVRYQRVVYGEHLDPRNESQKNSILI